MRVRQDFIDRLSNNDVNSFDEYKDYVVNKGHQFFDLFAKDGLERQLRRIEIEYFKHILDQKADPVKPQQLLFEFLEENSLVVEECKKSDHPGKDVLRSMELR